MSFSQDDILKRAAGTANRLRLAQTDFADSPEKTRQDYLADVVGQAIAELMPQERTVFLEELLKLFPTWDINVDVGVRSELDSGRTARDLRELQDPGFLIARLAELSQGLDEKERKVLQERLRVAGLVDLPQPELPAEPVQRVRSAAQMAAKAPLDPGRALDAAAITMELACTLDQLAWRTWKEMKEIASRTPFQHPGELRRLLGRFLGGDPDISRTQVQEDVQKLRQLMAAMIGAFRVAGRKFANRHQMTFAPAVIEGNVSPGWIKGKDAACWEKYKELAGSLDVAAIENEILGSFVATAEELMRGLNR